MADFYKCSECDSVLLDMNENVQKCQGGQLTLLGTNLDESVAPKHVPKVSVENGKVVVRVGAVEHPMIPEHHIEWVYVKTSYGGMYCRLNPGDEPKVELNLNPDEVEEVYEHCNIHGLWKANVPVLPADFEQNDVACSPEFALGCVNMTEE